MTWTNTKVTSINQKTMESVGYNIKAMKDQQYLLISKPKDAQMMFLSK